MKNRMRLLVAGMAAFSAYLIGLAGASQATAAWGTPILGSAPAGVATDTEHNVYVADTGANRIVKYNQFGAALSVFGEFGGLAPRPRRECRGSPRPRGSRSG